MNLLKTFWQKSLWSKLIIIVIGLLFFFAILGILSPQGQKSLNEGMEAGKKVEPEVSPSSSPIMTVAPTPRKLNYESWEVYNVGAEIWQSIIISPDATKEEVIMLAKELHRKDPNTHFNIFDDKTELKVFEKWHISRDKVYYPEDWDKKHGVGMINEMLTKEGLKWQFYSDSSKYLSSEDLE